MYDERSITGGLGTLLLLICDVLITRRMAIGEKYRSAHGKSSVFTFYRWPEMVLNIRFYRYWAKQQKNLHSLAVL